MLLNNEYLSRTLKLTMFLNAKLEIYTNEALNINLY